MTVNSRNDNVRPSASLASTISEVWYQKHPSGASLRGPRRVLLVPNTIIWRSQCQSRGGGLVHPQTLHLVLLLFLMTFLLLPFLLFLLLVLLLFCKILSLLLDLYHSHCTNMLNVYMWSGLHQKILQRQYFFIPMHTVFYIYPLVCHMRQFSVLVPL